MSLSRWLEPLLAAVGRGTGTDQDATEESESDEPGPPEPIAAHDEDVRVEDIPELVVASERKRVELGVGHLVGMPSIPRPLAEELVPLLLERAEDLTVGPEVEVLAQTDHDTRAMRRAGYRGLAVVAREHPALVAPHTARIAESLTSMHVIVRDACASALVAVLRRRPGRAGAVYPTLTDRRPEVRAAGLEVLVEVAETHPGVLAPLGSHLLAQLEEGEGDAALLVRGIARLGRRDPSTLQAAAPVLVDRLSVADEAAEAAIVAALLGYAPDDGALAADIAVELLRFLDRTDDADDERVLRHVLELSEDHRTVSDAIATWLDDQPPATRRRIRALVDEVVLRTEREPPPFLAGIEDPRSDGGRDSPPGR